MHKSSIKRRMLRIVWVTCLDVEVLRCSEERANDEGDR